MNSPEPIDLGLTAETKVVKPRPKRVGFDYTVDTATNTFALTATERRRDAAHEAPAVAEEVLEREPEPERRGAGRADEREVRREGGRAARESARRGLTELVPRRRVGGQLGARHARDEHERRRERRGEGFGPHGIVTTLGKSASSSAMGPSSVAIARDQNASDSRSSPIESFATSWASAPPVLRRKDS